MNLLIRLGRVIVLSCLWTSTFAVDLLEVFQQAKNSDPLYQKAEAQRLSAREAFPQSVSQLLPNISGTATDVATNTRGPSSLTLPGGSANYGTQTYALNLSQPIYNATYWASVSQANSVVKQVDATFIAAEQDLMIRVAQAYFNVLQAQDNLRVTRSQKRLLAEQLNQTEEKYDAGLGTVTEVYNAQAGYDGALAREISDRNNVANQFEALRAITGQWYEKIAALAKDVPLLPPHPRNVEPWVHAAEQQNFALKASRFAADAARENIKIQATGHFPTVSLNGSVSGSRVGLNTLLAPAGNTYTSTIGLQLNVPVFQGGFVNSKTRQAQYDFQAATQDMENIHRKTVEQTHQSFNDVIAYISRLNADLQSIRTNNSALEATQTSYEVGKSTIVDLLIAQKNLFDVQRQYYIDRYTYLNATLLLKQQAGLLSENDLKAINQWLGRPLEDKQPLIHPIHHYKHYKSVRHQKTRRSIKKHSH